MMQDSAEIKKNRGCVRPATKQVWEIDECPGCFGKKHYDVLGNLIVCKECGGKNKIPVFRCPLSMDLSDEFRILTYFVAYRSSNTLSWPDGRGRLYQPRPLAIAFDLLTRTINRYEMKNVTEN